MAALRSLFGKGAPIPAEPVELIYPRVTSHWSHIALSAVTAVLMLAGIPALVMPLPQLGMWLCQGPLYLLGVLATFLVLVAVSLVLHEITHFVAATVLGKVMARFCCFDKKPAVFWYGSMSRNRAILTAALPFALWCIAPLLMLGHLSPLAALALYVPISFNLVGSRADIGQACYMAWFLPRDSRIYCHPEGLAFALPHCARS